ncbi:MAG: lipocalin family protein [bacterium]
MSKLIKSLGVALLLAACARPAGSPPQQSFRTDGALMYSSAVLETAKLSGHWVQVATYAAVAAAGCAPGTVDFSDQARQVAWTLCLSGRETNGAGSFVPGKAGRYSVEGMADWWVLWADADYRTLVIGTPSGKFGFVLNRTAGLPPDRLKAVRDILTFNSYKPADLVVF